ncbi:tetratricopeptide repeat-containing sensor histidine kinase [Emticicia agri]|uniref:histidine kinase n=1 Tax=Emticicia agri TaxID=2492393 RepID=A0A4Q5M533_9BACT|nr:sensor histidine kinase [Emticicia agri]RYU97462.1 sensor histidine kinase [Emticicia agri]
MRLKLYLYFLFTFIVLSFHSLFLKAQENIKKSQLPGANDYIRLEKTKKEYEETILKGDSLEVADVCYRLGKRYLSIGDFYTAEKWFTRSLRILEPLGYSESLGKVYGFMAHFFIQNKQYDEAMQVIQKSAINFRNVGAYERLMGSYTMLAGIHIWGSEAKLKQPQKYSKFSLDSAIYYRKQADKIGKKINYHGNVIYNRNRVHLQNDYTSTIKYHKKIHSVFIKQKSSHNLFVNSTSLGEIYLSIRNFNEAKKWIDIASYIVDTANLGSYEYKITLFKLYLELNKKTHNYKEALKYYEQYHELNLFSLNADRDGAVSRLKIEYDTQKKEAQLKEHEKFTKIAIAIGIFTLFTSIIFFWFFRKYRTLSNQNAALVSEQNHRVKNNLQQVINLLSLQSSRIDDETAKKALLEALLRIEAVSIVHHRLYDGARLIEIDLPAFISELVKGVLRSYDYHDVSVNYEIDSSWLHVEQALPMGLIINELVTNACKYAFPNELNPQLTIQCYEKDKQILLRVTDNGPGFEHAGEKKTFGLKLIQLFAEKLKGKADFEKGGTSFSLSFQKQSSRTTKNMTYHNA